MGLVSIRLGQIWPLLDVLSSATPHVLILLASCVLAAFAPAGKTLCTTVLFTIGLTSYSLWPLLATKPVVDPLQKGERLLRIAHFNTHTENKNFDATLASIEELDADVVVLLEFTAEKLLSVYGPLKAKFPYIHTCIGQGSCVTAIISKHAFSRTDVAPRGMPPPHISVALGDEFRKLNIVGVHMQRFPNLARQQAHFAALPKLLEGLPGHIVVAGDFNASDFSRSMADLEAATGLIRQTNLPTWPAKHGLQQIAIDHILTSNKLRILSRAEAGDAAGSDHLPIAITLALPPD
jgi:endonuclease/exonuclease/phosphatase (EEP) superfamily protein YafD